MYVVFDGGDTVKLDHLWLAENVTYRSYAGWPLLGYRPEGIGIAYGRFRNILLPNRCTKSYRSMLTIGIAIVRPENLEGQLAETEPQVSHRGLVFCASACMHCSRGYRLMPRSRVKPSSSLARSEPCRERLGDRAACSRGCGSGSCEACTHRSSSERQR